MFFPRSVAESVIRLAEEDVLRRKSQSNVAGSLSAQLSHSCHSIRSCPITLVGSLSANSTPQSISTPSTRSSPPTPSTLPTRSASCTPHSSSWPAPSVLEHLMKVDGLSRGDVRTMVLDMMLAGVDTVLHCLYSILLT